MDNLILVFLNCLLIRNLINNIIEKGRKMIDKCDKNADNRSDRQTDESRF